MKRLSALSLCLVAAPWIHGIALAAQEVSGRETSEARSQIVFSSNRTGSWRLWTFHPDGTAISSSSSSKQLLDCLDPNAQDVDPAYSPDGKSILFTSTRGEKVGVWLVSEDGRGLQRVCDGDQAEWAPDGTKIVFRKNHKVWIRDLKTGAQRQIVPEQFKMCSGPSWSPDGNRIAFACRWDAGNGLFLVEVEARGGKPVKVYDKKGACEPHWSPDGKTLVYETETHICTIQPEGTKNRLITYYGGVQRYGQFSPDGKRIVFCQGVTENGPWQLYVVPSGGGTPTKLTDEGSDMNPDWR